MDNAMRSVISVKHGRRLKIGKSEIVLFLLFLPFIQQRSMQEFPTWLVMAYRYGELLAAAFVYLKYLSRIRIISASIRRLWSIYLIWILYVVITLLVFMEKFVNTFTKAFVLLAIALLVDMEVNKNAFRLIKVLAFMYTVYTMINNILVMIFPEGLFAVTTSVFHKGHLLGDDNAIIYVALPAMIILCLYSYLKNGKISKFAWINVILCEIVFVRLWAGSAMISFALFMVLLYVGTRVKPISLNLELIVFLSLMLLIFIGGTLPFVQYFIINILHKTGSFSSRSYMWAHAFELFVRSPIYGYGGYYTNGMYQYGKWSYPVHTPYLQMLVDGGILIVGSYFATLKRAYGKLQHVFEIPEAQIIGAGITAISLSYVFEWTQLYHMMIILTLAINIDRILEIRKNKII